MKYWKHMLIWLVIPAVIGFLGCSDDDQDTINEAQVLLTYLEANGNYINTSAPSAVAASEVRTNQGSPSYYIIDIRSSSDFAAGHVDGAHNVTLANLRSHYESVNGSSFTRVYILCYSGQTASYGASLLRMLGYTNVYAMRFGMSAWDSTFAQNYWITKRSNSRATQFDTITYPKGPTGTLPVLNTGLSEGSDILIDRVDTLLARGFSEALITEASVFANPSSYYIVNYWPVAHYYDPGHIPGAMQYEPKQSLKDSTFIRTLPTDKPIVVYCYTGTTSAFVAAYLRLLGYDARSLAYGANGMIYDLIVGRTGFTTFGTADIMQYPWVTGGAN
jgi:rhodanese-related sulfurtransferase